MLQVDIGLGIAVDMADDSGYLADSRPKSAEAPSTVMKMMMKKIDDDEEDDDDDHDGDDDGDGDGDDDAEEEDDDYNCGCHCFRFRFAVVYSRKTSLLSLPMP